MTDKINPQVQAVEIGVKTLREINILPLSIGDQTKLSEVITKAVKAFVEAGKVSLQDEAFVGEALDLIAKNLSTILELIVDDDQKVTPKKLLNEITNKQALQIAEIVYEENYGDIVKKVKGLIGMMGPAMPILDELQPSSSDTIPNTDLTTSTEDLGEMEA